MSDLDLLVKIQIQDQAFRTLGRSAENTVTSIRKADQAIKGTTQSLKTLGKDGTEAINRVAKAGDGLTRRLFSIGALALAARKIGQAFNSTAGDILKAGEEAEKAGKSIREISNGAFTEEHLAAARNYASAIKGIGAVGDQVASDLLVSFNQAAAGYRVLFNRLSGTGPQTTNALAAQDKQAHELAAKLADQKARADATSEETHKRILSTYKAELDVQKRIGEEAKKQADDITETFGKLSVRDQNAVKVIDKKISAGQKLNPYELDRARDLGVFNDEVSQADKQRGLDSGAGQLGVVQRRKAAAAAADQATEIIQKAIKVQSDLKVEFKADERQVQAALASALQGLNLPAMIQAEIAKNNQARRGLGGGR